VAVKPAGTWVKKRVEIDCSKNCSVIVVRSENRT
jgi:hypothetical protein